MTEYKQLAKEFFSEAVYSVRVTRDLTQDQMAEQLHISARAYGDLERGKYLFSSIALLFFLLILEDQELTDLLNEFRLEVRLEEIRDAA